VLLQSPRRQRGWTITQDDPFLTIIVPAYNEEARLPATLPQIIAFAEAQPYPVEVLVVDNASTDRTAKIVRGLIEEHSIVSLLHQPVRGKGAAVRKAMLEGRGEYRFICDADLAMPIDQVARFIPPAIPEYGVAIASREVPGAARYGEPWHRHLMGRIFNLIVRAIAVPGIQDTQCGFKCFTRDAASDIFSHQVIDGWAFDVEVIHIAQLHGYAVAEVPIDWYYGEGSRVRPLRDSFNMVREVVRIRRNSQRGLYDH
jgi:dolichyl-phosphate beta-glucosyltransferase